MESKDIKIKYRNWYYQGIDENTGKPAQDQYGRIIWTPLGKEKSIAIEAFYNVKVHREEPDPNSFFIQPPPFNEKVFYRIDKKELEYTSPSVINPIDGKAIKKGHPNLQMLRAK